MPKIESSQILKYFEEMRNFKVKESTRNLVKIMAQGIVDYLKKEKDIPNVDSDYLIKELSTYGAK
jgi:hypothetical protein